MKKFILLIALLWTANSLWADSLPENKAPEGSFAAQFDENQAIPVSDKLKLIPKTIHEENKSLLYVIDASYPELVGNTSVNTEKFNTFILKIVNQEISQFKKFVQEDSAHIQTLPDSVKHNTFHVDYDIDIVNPGDQALISVRFSTEGYQAGRAHPYHFKQVLNYDLSNGKVLTLNEIFKPNTRYLDFFAKYSRRILNAKLKDKFMIEEGTKPIAKNYKNWNLESDSIVITFDEYQVAPYYYGPQEVEIPLKELAKMISPKAPIYACIKDPESCK